MARPRLRSYPWLEPAPPSAPERRSSAALVSAVLGAVVIGGGAAVWLLTRDDSAPSKPDGVPDPAPAPAAPPAPPAVAAQDSSAEPPPLDSLTFTKATIALANQPDPYNPSLEALTIYLNQHQKLDSSSAAGVLYNGIRSIINAVPIVGSIVNIGMTLFEFIGPVVVGPSSGAWRDIPILSRQRAVLYQLTPSFYGQAKPYKSQQIDLTAPVDKPAMYYGVTVPQEEYDRQYRAWLRRFLQTRRYEAEFFRVARTLDEVMLPALVMEFLYREGAWPPPLEPMPPKLADFRARYRYTANRIRDYAFDDSVIDHSNPLTAEVYAQLQAEYADDSAAFSQRIAKITMPADLAWLADNAGCVPRWGSAANPLHRAQRRGGY